jgi:phosphohistidine phosphatase
MPKRLILVRHAKSAWDKAEDADFDRPLSARGRRIAPLIGDFLARQERLPTSVLCSSARRAAETWELMSKALPAGTAVTHSKSLYLAMPREMLKRIQRLPDDVDCALLVGHNPGIADLAGWLCTGGDQAKRTQLAKKYPTGAVAVIDFAVEMWKDIDADSGTLIDFVIPRDLAGVSA